jgi:hypothetical protein
MAAPPESFIMKAWRKRGIKPNAVYSVEYFKGTEQWQQGLRYDIVVCMVKNHRSGHIVFGYWEVGFDRRETGILTFDLVGTAKKVSDNVREYFERNPAATALNDNQRQ